jgi:lipid II:glycine glycyltransferase (peptidoglycan interpeptide bridge formation enzyme)
VVVERVGRDFLPRFTALYHETMQRRAAEPYYFFAADYFAQLADGLGGDFWLWRAHQGERDCAYALCLRHRNTLHYHLSCSDEATAETRATTLLLVEVARVGRAAGCRRFHLGGGYRGQDSLFDFKAHFSAERALFSVGTAVHDARVVDELAALARRAGAAPADPQFFPPYRSGR